MNIDEQLKDFATDIQSKQGSLDNNFYEGVTRLVSSQQKNMLNAGGDKTQEGKEMSNLNGTIAQVESIKETNLNLANALVDGDMSAWNDDESTKDHKKVFQSWMSKDNKVVSKDNMIGKMINGKFHSEQDIDKLLNESKKDYTSMQALGEIVINATNTGRDDKGINDKAKVNTFNEKHTRSQIMDVIKKGNIKSLMFDPILDGAPFVEEDLEMPEFKNITYKSIGLKPPKNDDDGAINETLTPKDARKIAAALADSSIGPELLGDYLTRVVKQNNQKAAGESIGEMAGMSAADIIKNFRNK